MFFDEIDLKGKTAIVICSDSRMVELLIHNLSGSCEPYASTEHRVLLNTIASVRHSFPSSVSHDLCVLRGGAKLQVYSILKRARFAITGTAKDGKDVALAIAELKVWELRHALCLREAALTRLINEASGG